MNWDQIYETAREWTLEAGNTLKKATTESFQVEYKTSAADLVTEKDKEIEKFFIDKISETFPTHFLLGEEGLAKDQVFDYKNEVVWVVDPIDGTTNFVHQQRNFAISVGIYENGKPRMGFVYDPISNELFHAQAGKGAYLNETLLPKHTNKALEEAIVSINQLWLIKNEKVNHLLFEKMIRKARGTRYIGSAALEIAYVACGRLDTYIDFRLSPWDIAGGMVILQEVGGVTVNLENQPVNAFLPEITIFSNQSVLKEIVKELS
ncbi:myo-inositol-1(or 4)-monophosphatase [Bacillus mesophilus]|uniref:inositol-phosphate phosphatase n=1 Tax=Bacillus mesophilus TaxID=1808955 RepID=A0A6M0Q4V0_9BACI|nr:inositol monophosphatase family protein [Bacillus mesophilus]MBM7659967.1 myo-inositol-1(or 4)-monophosphatase [Bacillus mesophilus]NEY70829.1 inositol monophosphatase family protein [Bacillus mesophilus]